MDNFLWVILASSPACAVISIGIFVINKFANWGNQNIAYFLSFAAGILLSVSFIHVVPKALSINENSPVFILVGFMRLFFLNRIINSYACNKHECKRITLSIITMIGIGLHSLIDGVIFPIMFTVSVITGVLDAIGMVLHEFPEGIVTFLLLDSSSFKRIKAVLWVFLAEALFTPLGTLVSYPFIHQINQSILSLLLSVSAGTLIYVGATHLLPAIEKKNKKNIPYSPLSPATFLLLSSYGQRGDIWKKFKNG
jgi:zinc and cadmium transporter